MGKPTFAFVFSSSDQFRPVTNGGELCTPDMVMFGSDNEVSFSGTPSVPNPTITLAPPGQPKSPQVLNRYQSATVVITVDKGKAPTFNFAVCDGNGDYTAYFLAGVALQNGVKSGVAAGQFPAVDVVLNNGGYTTLDLTDRNTDGNGYEFYVLVQNAQGQIGLIDPRIVNQT